ncbi:MAG: 30S ribosomal protein S9 [Planctomycetaceae bacterium]|nr:30S ribosomal protein S9 [Planctomycetaceae bacterium]
MSTDIPQDDQSSTSESAAVPQLTLGEGVATGEAVSSEPDEVYQPTIRGRLDKFGTAIGTGRRKTSVARVRIKDGSGKVTVNGRDLEDFFRLERDRKMVLAPVVAVGETGKLDIWVRVNGGGITGQAGAVVLGIARALQVRNESFHSILAEGGYLTRDDRMVERKKYGLRKARRSFQFSKR